jgi:hypothetical protein
MRFADRPGRDQTEEFYRSICYNCAYTVRMGVHNVAKFLSYALTIPSDLSCSEFSDHRFLSTNTVRSIRECNFL